MTSEPPAAWYADPAGSGGLRYWDGNAWTEHVTPPPGPMAYGTAAGALRGPLPPHSTPTTNGRKVWPWFVGIGVLFAVAVIAAVVMAIPRVVDAGGRVTDEAAQSTAHLAADTGADVYAQEGSYLGATPERLEKRESGLSFTAGPSTDFTTASVLAGEERFVVAVASLTNRCFVVILEDEIGGPRTTGRLPEGLPCWANLVADQPLEPIEGF